MFEMKISKNQLEQIILEELREQLLEQSRLEKMAGALKKGAKSVGSALKKGTKAAGQELGLSNIDVQKAKKDFKKMIQSSGGDYFKALSDFIGKYGDPKDDKLQGLRVEFDKKAQRGSGAKGAATRMRARAGARRAAINTPKSIRRPGLV